MLLKEVHPDVTRYLENDCYCPYEVYSFDGFGYMMFGPDTKCKVIGQSDKMVSVLCRAWEGRNHSEESEDHPVQVVTFFKSKEDPSSIVDSIRFDATENNISLISKIINDEDTEGMKFDEYEPGSTARSLEKIFSMCDAIMIG